MRRRIFLKNAAITAFGAGLPVSGALAQNRFAKYAGQTVTLSVPAHPQFDAMVDFEGSGQSRRTTGRFAHAHIDLN